MKDKPCLSDYTKDYKLGLERGADSKKTEIAFLKAQIQDLEKKANRCNQTHFACDKKIQDLEAKLAEAVGHRNKLLTISTLLYNDLLEYQDESDKPLSDEFKIAQGMLTLYDSLKEKWDEEFIKSLEEKEGEK